MIKKTVMSRVIECFYNIFLRNTFIYLAVLGLSFSVRDLVPGPRIERRSPALGVRTLNCWTTRELPGHS